MALQVRVKVSKQKETLPPNPDMLWVIRHYSRLREKYPDKWIAVRGASVVLSGDDLEALLGNLKGQFGDVTGFTVEFIGGQSRNLLL